MTHRLALVLSIALTLVVGAGVFAGRDRLFAPESAASPATVTSSAAQPASDTQAGQLTRTSPRIVTVTLPSTTSTASGLARGERSESASGREGEDHSRDDDERYEHDDEYDDD
jgi:hypothetical protein